MKTLRMKFDTDLGGSYILSISYCKEGLSAADVQQVMEAIKDADVLNIPIAATAGADIVDRSVIELV